MVLPRLQVTGPAIGRGIAAVVVAAVGLTIASNAVAFDKWIAARRFEISAAEGVSFRQPIDVAVLQKRFAVLDSINNRVVWFDAGGRQAGILRGTADIPLVGALGLTADPRGSLYLSDSRNGRILVAGEDKSIRVLAELPKAGGGEAPEPAGILWSGGTLFVADNGGHTVQAFDADGAIRAGFGGLGEGPGKFRYPFRLASDPRGAVGVSDVLNARVQFFTQGGTFLSSTGRFGVVSGTFYRPGGIDIDAGGNLWAADAYFGTVQVFSPEGTLLAVLCGADGTPLTLESPTAIRLFGEGLLTVESSRHRVTYWGVTRRSGNR
jgi:hypothetical protein